MKSHRRRNRVGPEEGVTVFKSAAVADASPPLTCTYALQQAYAAMPGPHMAHRASNSPSRGDS